MTEKLFQFIWQHKLFANQEPLYTREGEKVTILHSGTLNTHAGPDFLEAKIKLNDTLWAGHIELHLKSSDWNKHKHQMDKSYSNLILHVVYEYDEPISTQGNLTFSTLELKTHIHNALCDRYEKLMTEKQDIPCSALLAQINTITVNQQLDRMLAERLEQKTEYIQDLLERFQHNWQEVFYIELARGFGLHINQDTFERLALQTPLKLFAKHKHQLLQIEALLFGQAGFLNEYFDESYPMAMQQEYIHLKKLYGLHALEKHQWKFLRLRPANFPTLRLAQFAHVLHDSTHLFSKVTEANTIKELEALFQVDVSLYWLTHYTFKEETEPKKKSLGKTFIRLLLINVVIPTVFIYGKLQGKYQYCDKAIEWLKALPAEKNSILEQWAKAGITCQHAADSQALLQLKKHYCDKKRCLDCAIGYSILKPM